MKRLYPQVGRNLTTTVEPLVLGVAKTIRATLGTLAGSLLNGKSVASRLVSFIRVCCGLGALLVIHSTPNRWRRIVLWEQPNIGEFCLGTHYLLRWLDRQPDLDIQQYVFITNSCHNRTLIEMVRRRVRVVENKFLYEWCRPPFNTARAAKFWAYFGPIGDYDNSPPHLSFNATEIAEGQRLGQKMGLTADRPYICVHWRDSVFHAAGKRKEESTSSLRNTEMGSMLPTLQYLSETGFAVVRMGALVQEPLPEEFCKVSPGVIDYAKWHRTDLGDVFLPAHCLLFVGTNSGLFNVAQAFNRPLVLVDIQHPQYANHVTGNAIVIFKKYLLRDQEHYLTYKEMAARFPWHWTDTSLRNAGIEAVPNTDSEILAAVRECLEWLNGTDNTTDEDRELQKRFWGMFPADHVRGHRLPRIGRDFLRENRHLLG